jgi:membrane-associated phospholipid phosphatase
MASAPQNGFERRRFDIVAGLAGLVVLVVCAVMVHDGTVGSTERRIFEAINGLSDVLEPPMRLIQFLGVLFVGPIVAVVALILRRWRLALAALLVTAGKLVAERTVWHFVSRQRPGVTEPNAIVRGGTATSGAAFVSGHVILVTALAWVITPYLRQGWRFAPWVVVALVSFARLYLGAHNPLDVLGGIALGVVVGAAANLVVAVPIGRSDRAETGAR